KEFLGAVGALGLAGDAKKAAKMLIVDSLDNTNLVLSSRNVEKTKVTNSFGLNIYDIIYHEKVLISKTAVAELNDLLDPKREAGAAAEEAEAPKKPAKKAAKPKAEKTADAKEAKPKAAKTKKAEKAETEVTEAAGEATDNE